MPILTPEQLAEQLKLIREATHEDLNELLEDLLQFVWPTVELQMA
jgi:hypothetical protein